MCIFFIRAPCDYPTCREPILYARNNVILIVRRSETDDFQIIDSRVGVASLDEGRASLSLGPRGQAEEVTSVTFSFVLFCPTPRISSAAPKRKRATGGESRFRDVTTPCFRKAGVPRAEQHLCVALRPAGAELELRYVVLCYFGAKPYETLHRPKSYGRGVICLRAPISVTDPFRGQMSHGARNEPRLKFVPHYRKRVPYNYGINCKEFNSID